jgi:phage gp45-like
MVCYAGAFVKECVEENTKIIVDCAGKGDIRVCLVIVGEEEACRIYVVKEGEDVVYEPTEQDGQGEGGVEHTSAQDLAL